MYKISFLSHMQGLCNYFCDLLNDFYMTLLDLHMQPFDRLLLKGSLFHLMNSQQDSLSKENNILPFLSIYVRQCPTSWHQFLIIAFLCSNNMFKCQLISLYTKWIIKYLKAKGHIGQNLVMKETGKKQKQKNKYQSENGLKFSDTSHWLFKMSGGVIFQTK